MSQPTAPQIEVKKIDVEEGFNARTHMDEDALERLAANLARGGVVQPICVKPGKGDRFTVIAGHRRLRAAEIAGIEKIPVIVGEAKSARLANLVENIHREQLDPIDLARGLKALAEEWNLTTHKQIAEEASMSANWVSQHLRLLELPEGVQRHIAEGIVPVEAERCLRKVAEVSAHVAECVCELAKRRKVKPSRFVSIFGDLLAETAVGRFEKRPTMLSPSMIRLNEVFADAEKRSDLAARCAAVSGAAAEDPMISLGDEEIDAARAAGCLIEHKVDEGEWSRTLAFITDIDLAADLTERVIERREKQRTEWAEAAAKRRTGNPNPTLEEKKEARKAEHAEAKANKERARRYNSDLGRKLLQRRGSASRKEHALARAKALAAIVLFDNPTLAARGLRLITTQLQDVEVKRLKSTGESREKVSYADQEQCTEYLHKRVEDARSPNEVLELMGDAVIASLLADEEELAQSRRVSQGIGVSREVEMHLAADIKSVCPRRQRGKAKK